MLKTASEANYLRYEEGNKPNDLTAMSKVLSTSLRSSDRRRRVPPLPSHHPSVPPGLPGCPRLHHLPASSLCTAPRVPSSSLHLFYITVL